MNSLDIFVVYKGPKDLPGKYAVRRWSIEGGGKPRPMELVAQDETLEEVRAKIPPGLYPLARMPDDDPVIVETWV